MSRSRSTTSTSRRGRPKLPPAALRSHSLRFRVTDAERDLLRAAAALTGFPTASAWSLSRLLLLARSVVRKAGVDPESAPQVASLRCNLQSAKAPSLQR